MQFNSDNFITYSESPILFPNESFPDFDFTLPSPFQNLSPSPDPQQTLSSSYIDSLNPSNSSPPSTNSYSTAPLPQPIALTHTKEGKELAQVSRKSKTIQKRNNAKARAKVKQDTEKIMEKAAKKFIPTELEDPSLDIKTKRHLIQKVKNRVAAQKSRENKKNYINELEEIRDRLQEEARELNAKNNFLLEKVRELEFAKMQLQAENEGLRRRNLGQDNIDITLEEEEESNEKLVGKVDTVLTRKAHQTHNCLGYVVSFTAILAIYWGFKITHTVILQPEKKTYMTGPPAKQSGFDPTGRMEVTVGMNVEIARPEDENAYHDYSITSVTNASQIEKEPITAENVDLAADQAIQESAEKAMKLVSEQKPQKKSQNLRSEDSSSQEDGIPTERVYGSSPIIKDEDPYSKSQSESSGSSSDPSKEAGSPPNYSLAPPAPSIYQDRFGTNLVFSLLPLLLFIYLALTL